MCRVRGFDQKIQLNKTKLFLSAYRRICWSRSIRKDTINTTNGQYLYRETCLPDTLDYLENAMTGKTKEMFIDDIMTLSDSLWIKMMAELAMKDLKEFPEYGEMYERIIQNYYLGQYKYTESQMTTLLGIERSTYYDRKREAIMAFAVALWNNSIPYMKNLLYKPSDEKIITKFESYCA